MTKTQIKTTLSVSLIALFLACPIKKLNAQLITNGGFESPAIAGTSGFNYTSPQGGLSTTVLDGWTFGSSAGVSYDGVLVAGSGAGYEPQSGNQAAFFEGTGFVTQEVSLAAGIYTLSLGAAGRPDPFGPNPIELSLGSIGTINFSGSGVITPVAGAWNTYTSDQFTIATAGTYTLRIAATVPFGAQDLTSYVDNVSIAAVPEPKVAGLLAVGLVSGVLLRRRGQRLNDCVVVK